MTRLWRKPLDEDKNRVTPGEVLIIEERCKECGFCIEFCPMKCLEASQKFNKKGYHPPLVKNDVICLTCGYCQAVCPDFAIFSRVPGEPAKKEKGGAANVGK